MQKQKTDGQPMKNAAKKVAMQPAKRTEKLTTKEQIKRMRDRDREKVKGMFKFYEVPGGTLSFVYKAYKGDTVEKYTMIDGQIYEVPLGVARHLNRNGWYPRHKYIKTEGGTERRLGEKIHRFGFQSLDFIDIDEPNPQTEIITVEDVPSIE